MRMKRSDAIGCIQEILTFFLGYDVDGSTQCVGTKVRGDHAFIKLHTFDYIQGDIFQRYPGTF